MTFISASIARKIVNVTQTSASRTCIHSCFLFQTNRDLRSKDPIPNQAWKEAKRIRMGENTNRTLVNHADEGFHPRPPKETTKIRDQSQENLGEGASLV